ncbi:MAG TPA: cell division protein ZapA [Arenimonas sp.]|nr:cell division protein ZapA [Arenimonas sp.]
MSEPVNIKILDREYTVGVEPGEREGLTAAAQLVDSRMREVRGGNRMAAIDRVAVLTALNLAHELLQLRGQAETRDQALAQTLGELNRKLDGLFDTAR